MHREYLMSFENGTAFAKIMQQLRKAVMKKSTKPFTLDPRLINL